MLLSGCGRFGFDGASGDDGEVTPDAPVDASEGMSFSPITSGCMQAEAGPFTLVDTLPNTPGGQGYGLYVALPNIVTVQEAGGISNVHMDGGKFTLVDHLDGGFDAPDQLGWVEAVWSDGQHYFFGAPGRGLFVMDIDAAGKFVRLADNRAELAQARKGWPASNGMQFVASGDGGVKAIRYANNAIEIVGATMPMTSWAQGAWALGNRVVLADAGAVRVADFDGANYSETITPDTVHLGATRLWIDRNNVIFVANSEGVTAYRIVGTTVTPIDTFATAAAARDVWSDGQHVFVAAATDGTYALSFTNDHFAEVAHAESGGSTLGVFGDGKYIYTNDETVGLRAWSGFTCQAW